MAPLNIVLGNDPVIADAFFLQYIHRICLLQESVSNVLLIGQDLFDVAPMPYSVMTAGEDVDF